MTRRLAAPGRSSLRGAVRCGCAASVGDPRAVVPARADAVARRVLIGTGDFPLSLAEVLARCSARARPAPSSSSTNCGCRGCCRAARRARRSALSGAIFQALPATRSAAPTSSASRRRVDRRARRDHRARSAAGWRRRAGASAAALATAVAVYLLAFSAAASGFRLVLVGIGDRARCWPRSPTTCSRAPAIERGAGRQGWLHRQPQRPRLGRRSAPLAVLRSPCSLPLVAATRPRAGAAGARRRRRARARACGSSAHAARRAAARRRRSRRSRPRRPARSPSSRWPRRSSPSGSPRSPAVRCWPRRSMGARAPARRDLVAPAACRRRPAAGRRRDGRARRRLPRLAAGPRHGTGERGMSPPGAEGLTLGVRQAGRRRRSHGRDPRRRVHRDRRPERVRQVDAAARARPAAEAARRGGAARRQAISGLPGEGGRASGSGCCRSRRSRRTGSPWPTSWPAAGSRTRACCGSGRPRTRPRSSRRCARPGSTDLAERARRRAVRRAAAAGVAGDGARPADRRSCCSTSRRRSSTSPTRSRCSTCAPSCTTAGPHARRRAARPQPGLPLRHPPDRDARRRGRRPGRAGEVVTAELVERRVRPRAAG